MEKDEIKILRKTLGLTQQALAALLGVSFTTLNRWENGQVRPSQLALSKLEGLKSTRVLDATIGQSPAKSTLPSEAKLDFLADPTLQSHRGTGGKHFSTPGCCG